MCLLRSSFLLILLAPIRGLSESTVSFASPSDDELVPAGSPYIVQWTFSTTDTNFPATFDLYLYLGYEGATISVAFLNTVSTTVGSYIWTPSTYDASRSTGAWLGFNTSAASGFQGATYVFKLVVPAANSVSSTLSTTVDDTAYVPTTIASSSTKGSLSTTAMSDTVLSVIFASTPTSQEAQQTFSSSSAKSSDTSSVVNGSNSSPDADSSKATATTTNGLVTSVITGASSRASSTSQSDSGSSNETNGSHYGVSTVVKAGIGAAAAAIVLALLTILGVVLCRRRRSLKRSERIFEKYAFTKAELPGSCTITRPRSKASITRISFSTEFPPTTAAWTQPELAATPAQQVQAPPRPHHADLGARITNPAAELDGVEGQGFTAHGWSVASESQARGRAELGSRIDDVAHELSEAPASSELVVNSSDTAAELDASKRAELATFRAQRASQLLAELSASMQSTLKVEQHPVELLVDRLVADQQIQGRVKYVKKVEGFNFNVGR